MFRTSSIDTIPAGDTIHLHTFSVPVVNIQTAFTITAMSGASQRTLNGMVPAPHIAGITLRDTAASGTTQSAMLFLTARVPSSGLPVTFGSSSPIVESTSSPFISGGQSAALLLRIGVVTQATVVELTFGLNGSTHHKTLTVLPPQLSAFSASPTTVHPGSSVTLTATLTAAAPAGGRRVLIAAPGAPAFPPLPSIFVPAGATSGSSSFSLANLGLPDSIQVNLTATLDQVSKTVVVTVTP
jgi:hypothetical protein